MNAGAIKWQNARTPTTVYVEPFKVNFCPDVLTNPVLAGGAEDDVLVTGFEVVVEVVVVTGFEVVLVVAGLDVVEATVVVDFKHCE